MWTTVFYGLLAVAYAGLAVLEWRHERIGHARWSAALALTWLAVCVLSVLEGV